MWRWSVVASLAVGRSRAEPRVEVVTAIALILKGSPVIPCRATKGENRQQNSSSKGLCTSRNYFYQMAASTGSHGQGAVE
jgi:hypothetical protein